MKKYDFIFAGGGLSATVLLYFFLQSPLKESKFLVIDTHLRHSSPRGWSFWLDRSSPFDDIVTKKWKKFAVSFPNKNYTFSLKNYEISYLESKNYYTFIDKVLSEHTNVHVIKDEVTSIKDSEDYAYVYTPKRIFQGKFVFDSATYQELSMRDTDYLVLQGLGGEVVTKESIFNPDSMVFMDFRESPTDELLFYYSMPITQNKAYIDVAHVIKRNKYIPKNTYTKLLDTYIKNTLGIRMYTFRNKQYAKIPLHVIQGNRTIKKHVLLIGTKGGKVNPISSYGFVNILNDSEKIVEGFVKNGKVGRLGVSSKLTQLIETAMTDLMKNNPTVVKQMYKEMFGGKYTTGDNMLAFLNNDLAVLESIKLISQVNPKPMADTFRNEIMNIITNA